MSVTLARKPKVLTLLCRQCRRQRVAVARAFACARRRVISRPCFGKWKVCTVMGAAVAARTVVLTVVGCGNNR